jgi:hypothetical protein
MYVVGKGEKIIKFSHGRKTAFLGRLLAGSGSPCELQYAQMRFDERTTSLDERMYAATRSRRPTNSPRGIHTALPPAKPRA